MGEIGALMQAMPLLARAGRTSGNLTQLGWSYAGAGVEELGKKMGMEKVGHGLNQAFTWMGNVTNLMRKTTASLLNPLMSEENKTHVSLDDWKKGATHVKGSTVDDLNSMWNNDVLGRDTEGFASDPGMIMSQHDAIRDPKNQRGFVDSLMRPTNDMYSGGNYFSNSGMYFGNASKRSIGW